ncbi:MAG TPA: hypothetical protein VFV23_08075 [Verrucomicrobiae bacterium]|nr:hypothetical protein [Verrucomicrobiae bacterium]
MNPDDAKLSALLREGRASPSLPPRFQQNVWQRIEDIEAPKSAHEMNWVDAVVALLLRPRFAFATAAALIILGISLGAFDATKLARQNAEARYVAIVAPNSIR